MTKNEYSLSKIINMHSICFFYLIFLKHILLPIDTFISFEKFFYIFMGFSLHFLIMDGCLDYTTNQPSLTTFSDLVSK